MRISERAFFIAMANKGYSKKELAKRAGVSVLTVTNLLLHGAKAYPATIGKLAKALNVEVTDLLAPEN